MRASRVVVAFCEQDSEALSALVSEDFEWLTPTATSDDTTTYRGRDGVRQFIEDSSLWEIVEGHVDEIRELDEDRVLVLGELFWRDRRDGSLKLGGPLSSVLDFERGMLKRMETFKKASKALAAAGLEV
jgi:ketosteroid isomerase-like protein